MLLTLLDSQLEAEELCSIFPRRAWRAAADRDPGAQWKSSGSFCTVILRIRNRKARDLQTGIFVEPALLDSSNIVELVNSFLIGHVANAPSGVYPKPGAHQLGINLRSICVICERSDRVAKVEAVPVAPARPVRPTR